MDFRPSRTARNLSLGRRGSIGIVVDSRDDPWLVVLLSGIEEELGACDASLLLAGLELDGQQDLSRVIGWIRDRRVDGLIVAKVSARERAIVDAAAAAKLPLVAVGPEELLTGAHHLSPDSIRAGAEVTRYLLALGHTAIAFVGPKQRLHSRHRQQGMREALSAAGTPKRGHDVYACRDWDVDAGVAFAREFLSCPRSVTALVMASDALALGFLRVAHERRVRVPEMMSVVGFDGLPTGQHVWPGLTTMALPTRDMGRAAVRTLFNAIDRAGPPATVRFPMSLLVRESTGPVRWRVPG